MESEKPVRVAVRVTADSETLTGLSTALKRARPVHAVMTETVLFESESEQTRAAIASYLRNVAETLEGGRDLTLKAGEESVTVDPPAESTFEVRAERDGPAGTGEMRIGFELGWDNGDDGPDEPEDSG